MNIDKPLASCIDDVAQSLKANESIVRVRRAEPEFASHADYFTRYKVDIATLNGGGTQPTNRRGVAVRISSNTGAVDVEPSTEIPDLG